MLVGGDFKWYYILGRLELYRATVRESLSERSGWIRLPVSILMEPLFIAYVVLSFAFYWAPRLGLFELYDPLENAGLIVSYFVIGSFYVSVLVGLVSRKTPRLFSIIVWYKLCNSLGFDDRVLFGIAGVRWVWWIRRQPIDSFFRSKSKEPKRDVVYLSVR